jgi:hypothetical protein
MNNPHHRNLLAGTLALLCQSASAASLSPRPAVFSTSNEGNLYQGYGVQQLASPTFFTADFEPFDESLGSLQSFTIRCRINGELVGMASDAEATGTASSGFGGTFSIGGFAFDGTGGPGGNGVANSGALIDVAIGIPDYERNLTVANAGVSYDPSILSVVTGDVSFPISFNTGGGVMVSFGNVADLQASLAATISITYLYQPVAGGTPKSITVTGVLRDAAAEKVTVEWTSSADKSYSVDASANLVDWEIIAPVVPGVSGTTAHTDTAVPASVPRRFYRIRERN